MFFHLQESSMILIAMALILKEDLNHLTGPTSHLSPPTFHLPPPTFHLPPPDPLYASYLCLFPLFSFILYGNLTKKVVWGAFEHNSLCLIYFFYLNNKGLDFCLSFVHLSW